MKYCTRCKKLFFGDEEKCECGRKLKDKVDPDTAVTLICASFNDKDRIKTLLDEEEIPNSLQRAGNLPRTAAANGFGDADYVFYVPYCFYKKSVDLMIGAADMTVPAYYDLLPDGEDTQWEEMSTAKRRAVKLLSGIGFAVLVWLCVAGVDLLANLISELFSR